MVSYSSSWFSSADRGEDKEYNMMQLNNIVERCRETGRMSENDNALAMAILNASSDKSRTKILEILTIVTNELRIAKDKYYNDKLKEKQMAEKFLAFVMIKNGMVEDTKPDL